ncbi:EamA family transporter [Streptomyces sp. E5N91]|uniref:EamA family transporter n=1 Tax=Streptomyces sp. E5N91 TaxID=1851996 RepID=UPI0019310465|nr:EamA family transporter [Streptomyces sp. E5N91]
MQPAPSGPADGAVLPSKRGSVTVAGLCTMLASGLSTQLGAAVGSLAFPALGAVGVVAVRQYVAAAVLLLFARPRLWSFTRRQWALVLLLAADFGVTNLSLYTAIDRIGLGLAVTLEFLGPLTIALAGSRRRVDVGCAVLAVAGVVALMRPRLSADYLGLGLGLLAAAGWAAYILLNRCIGRRIPGAQGTAAAAVLSAVVFLPIGAGVIRHHMPSAAAFGAAIAAGVLSSAVPFLADLFTLRRVPTAAFGLFMSVNPVLAAAVGALVLGQSLDTAAWFSIAAIIAANAVSVLTPSRRA